MKLMKHLTCVMIAVAFIFSAAPIIAQDDAGGDKPAKKKKERKKKEEGGEKKGKKKKGEEKGGDKGLGAELKELQLKEGQKDKITAIVNQTNDAKKELAQKIKELGAKAKAAKDNKEESKKIKQEMGELKKQIPQLEKDQNKKILEVLDEKQKSKYKGLQAYKVLLAQLKKAKLTEEQNVKVKDICLSSGDAIDMDNLKNSVQSLMKKVIADVLDEEQKKLFEKKGKGGKEGGEKKEKGNKGKGKKKKGDPAEQ